MEYVLRNMFPDVTFSYMEDDAYKTTGHCRNFSSEDARDSATESSATPFPVIRDIMS